jgi:hypothetical protein
METGEQKQMTIFTKQTELEKLAAMEIELTAKKSNAVAALGSARTAAGLAAVDGDAESEIAEVVRYRAQADAAETAIGLIRERRGAAITAEYQERARQLRESATGKRRELSALESKTARLLAELSKLEGISYSSDLLEAQAPPEGIIPGFTYCLVPRSAILRSEIADTERKAVELESTAVPAAGTLQAEDITTDAEVITRVLLHASHGPSAAAIQLWLERCANNAALPGRSFGMLSRQVRLFWRNGLIDVEQSYIFIPSLAKTLRAVNSIGMVADSQSFDTTTATFRAAA